MEFKSFFFYLTQYTHHFITIISNQCKLLRDCYILFLIPRLPKLVCTRRLQHLSLCTGHLPGTWQPQVAGGYCLESPPTEQDFWEEEEKRDFLFQGSVRFQEKLSGKSELTYIPSLTHVQPPHYQQPRLRGTLATADEPALTHHYWSQSRVHLRAHSWCYTFDGCGQKYDDMYPLFPWYTQ